MAHGQDEVVTYPALLPAEGIARLRDALAGAGYTAAGIAAHIGPEATAATRRNDFRAALSATTAGTPLDTLIRLYVGNQTESEAAVARALAPLPLDDAVAAGLIERVVDGLRAGLDLEPYGDAWWVVSDLPSGTRPGPLRPDHVLGVGNASTTLADSVIRTPVGSALDLGTGCGVQARARRASVPYIASKGAVIAFTRALSHVAGPLQHPRQFGDARRDRNRDNPGARPAGCSRGVAEEAMPSRGAACRTTSRERSSSSRHRRPASSRGR